MTLNNLAIYRRAAFESGEGPNALDAQLKRIQAFASRENLEIKYDVFDTGSAVVEELPELRRLLEMARKGELDALLVSSPDRLFRNSVSLVRFLEEMHKLGVKVMSADGSDIRAIRRRVVGDLFAKELLRQRQSHAAKAAWERRRANLASAIEQLPQS